MEQNEEIEMQLWEYLDGTCTIAGMQRISVLIERDAVWKERFDELSALHSGISASLELEQPPLRFTKNVMEAVAATHIAPATKKYVNKTIIRGIAAFFILMLTITLAYAFTTASWTTSTNGVLPKINLSSYFNSTTMNVIIAVNVVIALVLVDTLLRRKRDINIIK